MPIPILMPALSPTMTEGNIAKWLKKEGDKIKPGDVIAEVETDKATMEVESIDEGSLAKILTKDGQENVKVNSLIGVIALPEDKSTDIEAYLSNYSEEKENIDNTDEKTSSLNEKPNKTEIKKEEINVKKNQNNENKIIELELPEENEPTVNNISEIPKVSEQENKVLFVSPLAKRIAKLKNIDLNNIKGSGPKGRIVKRDLIEQKSETISNKKNEIDSFQKITLSNIRKTIAKRLSESKQNIPHYYLKSKISINALIKARTNINKFLNVDKDNSKQKISLNDLFIKATAMSLSKVPALNSTWNEDSILQYRDVDIGVAVATENGLFTPIIKMASKKSVSNISDEMKNFVKKASAGKLLPEEYTGGSFSISNLGMYEIDEFAAIINPPQSGILAIGGIVKEFGVENDKPVEKNMITFTLSVDHRIADGAQAANFFKYFKYYITNPVGMII